MNNLTWQDVVLFLTFVMVLLLFLEALDVLKLG
jgi:hypothetical protein